METTEKATIDVVGEFLDRDEIQLHGWVMNGHPYGHAYVGDPPKFSMCGYTVDELRELAREAGALRA